jgi:SsrA-binding protein
MSKHEEKVHPGDSLIATNRRVRHDYFVHEIYECGLELKGTEVKSVRNRKVSIDQAFGRLLSGELHIVGMNIAPYEQAGVLFQHEPLRPRKLLLRKREIEKIVPKIQQKGFTFIPLRMYFRHGFAKIEMGIATGKKLYDKREELRKRDAQRTMKREIGKARRMMEDR